MKNIYNTASRTVPVTFLLLLAAASMSAQEASYSEFLRKVAEKNTGYLVEKYNIDIAEANLQAAKVFNDPELSFAYANNQDWDLQMGQNYEVGLSYSLSLGNVRGARKGVALTEKEITDAAVEEYFRNLKAEAVSAYANAWGAMRRERIMRASYENMLGVASSDSLRLETGDLNQTDAMQSALEAKTMKNQWIASRTEYENALTMLSVFIGGERVESVTENLDSLVAVPDFPLPELIGIAVDNRSDLKVAELTKQLSQDNLRLVKASRAMELTLSAGYVHSNEVRNQIAPAPTYDGLNVGVAIPLKFSSANKGEKVAAQNAVMQSEKAYQAAMEQIYADVTTAYNSCRSAEEIMRSYDSSIIEDARLILENRTLGYRTGETGILELLNAQRSYNEILSDYVAACMDLVTTRVELQRALGLN